MKKMNRFGKILPLFFAVAAGFVSCQEDDAIGSAGASLQVSVTAGSPMVSRAIVTDEYLPDGSTIGVTVTDADGNSYDNQNYSNVKYTAAGQGEAQTWTGASDVSLSTTVGKAVAYYPWQEGADLTAIPVETASQTDYMYSKPVTGLSLASPAASFTMQHALTDIRIKVIRGDYTGEGALESVSVKSSAFATGATLNVHDGSLASISGAGTEFKSEYTDKSITAEGLVQDYLVVPVASVTSGDVSVFIVVDGKKFTAPVQFTEVFLQGATYSFGLVLDNAGLNVTSVTAEKWGVVSQVVAQPELQPNPDEYIIRVSIPEGEDNNGGVEEASVLSLNPSSNDALKTAYKKFMEGRTAPVINSRAAADTRPFVHNVVGFVGTIDWGDGTTDTYDVATDWPTHQYTEAGDYFICAKGTMTGLSVYFDWENEDFPYFSEWLAEFIFLGEDCGVESLVDAFLCSKMHYIPESLNKALKNVESFNGAFYYCTNLTSIPEGLFDKCTEVTDFGWTFCGCTALTSIPAGLFDNNTEVTNFQGIFSECSALQAIPEGLFDNCTKVTDFERTFYNCRRFETIPAGLFDNCTKLMGFNQTFRNCYALQTIPAGLFDKCTEVVDFGGTFYQCESLQAIPEGLFDNCTKVTDFRGTFKGCTSLQSLPGRMFNSNVQGLSYTFEGCTGLTDISEYLFENCNGITYFYETFRGCTALQAIPEGLFDHCTEVTNFERTFEECTSLTSIPEGLFDYNTKVTSFYSTFEKCTSLQSIPEGLFDNCTEVEDFRQTFNGCTALTDESPYTVIQVDGVDTKVHLYERSAYPEHFTAPTNYVACFRNCTGLTDYASILSTWK